MDTSRIPSDHGEVDARPGIGAELDQASAYGVRVEAAPVAAGTTYWKCVDVHHLSADENHGRHCVFVRAEDEAGNRARNPSLRIGWTWQGRSPDESAEPKPLDKPDGEIGHGLVDLFGSQRVEVWLEGAGLLSDHVANLHAAHDEIEKSSDGQDGNSPFHHSFLVTFRQVRVPAVSGGPGGEPSSDADNGPSTPVERDAAQFLREDDDTPDGTVLGQRDVFEKSWVLRNAGTSEWTDAYRIVFAGGQRMGVAPSMPIPGTPAGAECRVTLHLTAPESPGRYRSVWQLADSRGHRFGDAVWTEIVVDAGDGASRPDGAGPLSSDQVIDAGPDASPDEVAVAGVWNRYAAVILDECNRLAIDAAAAVAVLVTESRGEPFDAAGRMIIRFENHVFFRQWGSRHKEQFDRHFRFDPNSPSTGHEWRAAPDDDMQPCHTGNEGEWSILEFARRLDDTAALSSISMGAPQIMGFNHSAVGYATPQAMFEEFQHDAEAQMRAMFRFVEVNGLMEALRRRDFVRFAEVYNGPRQPALYAGIMRGYAATFARLATPDEVAGAGGEELEVAGASSRAGRPKPAASGTGVPVAGPEPASRRGRRKHFERAFFGFDANLGKALDATMNPDGPAVWASRVMFSLGVLVLVMAATAEVVGQLRARRGDAAKAKRGTDSLDC